MARASWPTGSPWPRPPWNGGARSPADRQRHCEEAAILVSIDNLLSYPWIQERVAAHELSLHAWYFDMSQGSLLAYFPDSETFEPLVARCRQCGALDAACGCHAHGVQD